MEATMIGYLKNDKGFTLIELLAGLAILGFIVVPLSTYFISSAKIGNDSKKQLIANHLAQKYMEKIRSGSNLPGEPVEVTEQGFFIRTVATAYETGRYSLPEGEEDSFHMMMKFEQEDTGRLDIFDRNNVLSRVITGIMPDSDIVVEIRFGNIIRIQSGTESVEISYTPVDDVNVIKIQFISYKNTNVDLHVFNHTTKTAEIFVVQSKGSTSTIHNYPECGSVLFHKEVLDSSYRSKYNNRIYQVTVSVQEGNRYDLSKSPIAELTSLQKAIE